MIQKISFIAMLSLAFWFCTNQSHHSSSGKPKLVCEEDFFDFGVVHAGDTLEHAFEIKNTGDADLIIHKVIPSCGCTVADYDDSPIAPGKTREIKIAFNTRGRKGVATKEITIKSNAVNDTKTLTFKANIVEQKDENK